MILGMTTNPAPSNMKFRDDGCAAASGIPTVWPQGYQQDASHTAKQQRGHREQDDDLTAIERRLKEQHRCTPSKGEQQGVLARPMSPVARYGHTCLA